MRNRTILILMALIRCVTSPLSAAPVGTAFTYQGRLNDGAAPASGNYDLRVAIYDSATGPTIVGGPLTNPAVSVSNGLFTVALDFGATPFNGSACWLDLGVRSNSTGNPFAALAPRQKITPTPYALHAATAGVVSNGSVMASQLKTIGAPGAGQILTYDGSSLVWQNPAAAGGAWAVGGNNAAGGNFVGTLNNLALDLRVNNSRALRLEPNATSPNVIAGWSGNSATPGIMGGTIGGGGAQLTFGRSSTNKVTDDFCTVSGGANNVAGNDNAMADDGWYATVGGGQFNRADGVASTIGGGSENRTSNNDATVGGGYQNTASGIRAAIAGGWANTASGGYAAIGGGQNNNGGADFATVSGGLRNAATGFGATVAGGVANVASGSDAMVPGGSENLAAGSSSFAAGSSAQALHNGSFVWADSQFTPPPIPMGIPFASIAQNEFAIRAKGGVRFNADTSLYFGNQTRQMLNLWGTGFAIGVQNATVYQRTGGGFAWHLGGSHSDATYDSGGGTTLMTLDGGGLNVRGLASVCALTIRGGCDVAEPFPMNEEEIEKGSVVVIDDKHPGQLRRSTQAYDTRVAGIVSGANGIKPGIALKQEGALDQGENVALTGRVYVRADASFGAIKPGDLLTTSDTPGHAMKVINHARAQGAVLGKAMSTLDDGKGMVLVLVTLQ